MSDGNTKWPQIRSIESRTPTGPKIRSIKCTDLNNRQHAKTSTFINATSIYRLILRSKTPTTEQFTDWFALMCYHLFQKMDHTHRPNKEAQEIC